MPKNGFAKIFLIFLVIIILSIIILLRVKQKIDLVSSTSVGVSQNLAQASLRPSPTPFLFEEMTIPYFRKKDFNSQLGGLTKIGENQSYTSYLTSYISEGLKINGLLTLPQEKSPAGGFPAIVFVHGYIPPASYKTGQNYASYVDYLAKNGFVVFKIDLRGHGDSEGEAGGGYYSGDYIIDTLNAYAALQTANFINPQKIGLWGHSMAGNVAMRAFAARPEIKAVAIWAGAVYTYLDLSEYGIQDSSYQPPPQNTERVRKRQLLIQTYGQPKDGNPFWDLVAPSNYLTDLKGALSLHHAVNDDVVSIEYSRNLTKLLDQTNVVHQLQEYPSGGHNITGDAFNAAMQDTIDFFKKYLY